MKNESTLRIGFDDTDSPKGMCTTYLAYKMVHILKKQNVEFLDFPRLVRFNPNIPWKTRGNGAVGISIKTKNPQKIKNLIKNLVKKYSDIKNGANPGLVFFEEKEIPNQLKEFSQTALSELIQRNHVKKFVKENNIESFHVGNGQGLIGAIGAIGYEFNDHTLELISYRKKSHFGTKRKISKDSVKKLHYNSKLNTFNNFDSKKDRILISPHGPDPVFYGIRGENPKSLFTASKMIKTDEKLDGYMLFKSNQGTGDHLKNFLDVEKMQPYSSGIISGKLATKPTRTLGGHVFFSINVDGKKIDCAVYKPTGLTSIAMELTTDDQILIGGGIRKASKKYPRVINIEFIKVEKLSPLVIHSNPMCIQCNKKMKSKGKNQGFECIKCKKTASSKNSQKIKRNIKKALYIPIPSAHRHLTRPKERLDIINRKNTFKNSIPWFLTLKN